MSKSRKLIITAAAALMIFGCQRSENGDKTAQADNKSPEAVIEAVLPGTDDAGQTEMLKEENKRLAGALADRDGEISRLKAELASEQASNANMQAAVADAGKAKRNISFIAVISAALNIIFIFFLIKAKRAPKRLALPEGRKERDDKADEPSPDRAAPAENNAGELRTVTESPKPPAKRGRPAGKAAKKNGVRKPGRPPKNKSGAAAASKAEPSENREENK